LAPLLGNGISKPQGYLTYNKKTQSADVFWPTDTEDEQKNAQAIQHITDLITKANAHRRFCRRISHSRRIPLVAPS
jgi:cholesterol oxidase